MPDTRHQVEMCSMRPADDGNGFVMELADGTSGVVRLDFPGWIIPQLMRMLPRLDAAAQAEALVAYPLQDWTVENAGGDLGIALHLRDDRQVDAAFHLDLAQAAALHHELGDAIARAAWTATRGQPPLVN